MAVRRPGEREESDAETFRLNERIQRRSEIATAAVTARWAKAKKKGGGKKGKGAEK